MEKNIDTMIKYFKIFDNHAGYTAYTASTEFITPNVSVCKSELDVHYNPYVHGPANDYFTTVAREDVQFTFMSVPESESEEFPPSISAHSYSIDDGQTWTQLQVGTNTPTISAGTKVLWKSNLVNGYCVGVFSSTGQFDAEGNVMSLVYGDDFTGQTSLQGYEFALTVLFGGCSNVINIENLSLPATELSMGCYLGMFWGCTSLTSAPELPTMTLADGCYQSMFEACTSLTSAPELPAMTLAEHCYENMFYGCTSLTTAPELSATTLANGCYLQMFSNCTSLTTAPVLSATTLAPSCYTHMFYNCTTLNSITCLATDISASNCTNYWVYNVASSGTFTKAAGIEDWTRDWNGIPSGWTVVDNQ